MKISGVAKFNFSNPVLRIERYATARRKTAEAEQKERGWEAASEGRP
jgi:hypothetical protein